MIEHGHRRAEIEDYTVAEVWAYLDAIADLEKDRRAYVLHDNFLAAQGDGQAIKNAMKGLLK